MLVVVALTTLHWSGEHVNPGCPVTSNKYISISCMLGGGVHLTVITLLLQVDDKTACVNSGDAGPPNNGNHAHVKFA